MAEQTQNRSNMITEGVIWKQLLYFFFPIMLGTFFQQLYNTADAVIVGNFLGSRALAAVGGSTELLIQLVTGFFVGISSGAGVIISQYYGAGKIRSLKQATHTALLIALAGGIFFTLAGLLAAPWALKAMGTPEEIMTDAMTYLRVYSLGMIPVLLYNMGAGILRAVGNSRTPMYLLIICCILNVFLDLLFVAVFRWGVFGAALATAMTQTASAVLVMASLLTTKDVYRIELKGTHFSPAFLRNILWIGLPVGLQSVMYSFSNVILQSNINSFGTDTIAAWTVFSKIDGIFWMIQNSLGIAITTFVGQNFGAGKYDRVGKSVQVGLAMSVIICLGICPLFLIFRRPLYGFFMDDPQVIQLGVYMMGWMVPTYITYAGIEVLSGTIRGTGETIKPLLITCTGSCLMRIIWVSLMLPRFRDIRVIIFSYPISWLITTGMFLFYYKKGKWRRQMDAAAAGKEETPWI